MIIRRQGSPPSFGEDSDEISIDFERICAVARKKAGLLAVAALLGCGLGLACCYYKFSKPAENRLETDILFFGPAEVTGVTGVTGVREIDAVLSTFDPRIEIQEIVRKWPDGALLNAALSRSGLRRTDSMRRSSSDGNSASLEPPPSSRFFVQDEFDRIFSLSTGFTAPRNKPLQLVLQGTVPEAKLKLLAECLFESLNGWWRQEALSWAQLQRPYAEKVRAQLVEQPAGAVGNLPQLAHPVQITADLSLLSNYQTIRLIDQFLDKLENWPPQLLFAHPGKQGWSTIQPSRALWALPLMVGAGFLVGVLVYFNFFGSLAGKVLGEHDLAAVHPAASIYPAKLASAELVNLMAASFAHASQKKSGKLAVFAPQAASDLIEKIRLAAEGSNHTFSKDGLGKAEVCLFLADDLSGQIARLPSQGFVRILLTSKKAESLKIRHKFYQAEADLAGIPITDVVLIDD